MSELDEDQLRVLDLINNNKNVLLVGMAGTGKSRIISELKENTTKHVYITSTTGVSALNISGVTLHSFLGIGLGDGTKEELFLKVVKNYPLKKILSNPSTLIVIDEVSMLGVSLFEKIDYIFKKLRYNNKPFGGIQLLLSGDFLQLEPINDDTIYKHSLIDNFEIVQLTRNYRQKGDDTYQKLLSNLRYNELTDEDISLLKSKAKDVCKDENPVRIFTTNAAVNAYNAKHTQNNKEKEYVYKAVYKGSNKYYTNDIQKQFKAKNIDILSLKKNLKVMLTKNLDIKIGLVNGSLGTITDFVGGLPKVKFNNGVTQVIEPATWEMLLDNKIVASAKQIPLVIAYALTVHKCQGLTLNSAVIDLKNSFAPHMIYVALSRVKNLDNLTLLNFNENKININEETKEFYKKLG